MNGMQERHENSNQPFVKGKLKDPEFAKKVAEAFVAGLSRPEMSEIFGVSTWTITQWRRDARVKVHALKLIEDRVLQVTRRVDAVVSRRLEDADKMTTKELLEIRKEYLGGALRQQTEKADAETIDEAMTWLDDNPEDAAALQDILDGKRSVTNLKD